MFCPFCQKSVKILEKHKKTCLKNPENQKVLQNSPYPVSEIPYLETLPKFLQKFVRVSYTCEKCGRTKTQGFLYTRNFTKT